MVRNTLIGAAVFGVLGAAAAWIWTTLEFPFAIVVPAMVGWFAVTRGAYGNRKALIAGLVGGLGFTAVFIVAMFFALTDGSPVQLTGWMAAVLAAAAAGALTGWVLGGGSGSLVVASFSAAGMLMAVVAAGLLKAAAPSAVNVAGTVQAAYFTLSMGVVATIVGAASGAAVARISHKAPAAAE